MRTILFMLLLLTACTTSPPPLGLHDGRLQPCPASPNCVSSDAADATHRVEPFDLVGEPQAAWQVLQDTVRAFPRTAIMTVTPDYLHAEFRSFLFRFVDDVEFHLRPAEGIIAVRSASRVGYSDLGVNRERVENLRQALRIRGMVR
jgi:uncharacterized protein (DUF1499 family)